MANVVERDGTQVKDQVDHTLRSVPFAKHLTSFIPNTNSVGVQKKVKLGQL